IPQAVGAAVGARWNRRAETSRCAPFARQLDDESGRCFAHRESGAGTRGYCNNRDIHARRRGFRSASAGDSGTKNSRRGGRCETLIRGIWYELNFLRSHKITNPYLQDCEASLWRWLIRLPSLPTCGERSRGTTTRSLNNWPSLRRGLHRREKSPSPAEGNSKRFGASYRKS